MFPRLTNMILSRKMNLEQFVKYGYQTERADAIKRLADIDCLDLPEHTLPIPAYETPKVKKWGSAAVWGFISSILP